MRCVVAASDSLTVPLSAKVRIIRVRLAGESPDRRARSARDWGPWTSRSTRTAREVSDRAGNGEPTFCMDEMISVSGGGALKTDTLPRRAGRRLADLGGIRVQVGFPHDVCAGALGGGDGWSFVLGQPAPDQVALVGVLSVLATPVGDRASGADLGGARVWSSRLILLSFHGWKNVSLCMPRPAACTCQDRSSLIGGGDSRPFRSSPGSGAFAGIASVVVWSTCSTISPVVPTGRVTRVHHTTGHGRSIANGPDGTQRPTIVAWLANDGSDGCS